MKLTSLACLFLLLSISSYAQPRWSPEIRSDREMKWLQDSVHISPEQAKKIAPVSVAYQRQMDKTEGVANKIKAQEKLMHKKDANLKVILDKEQYKMYYRREQQIRKQEKVVYKGKHQPN